MNLLFSRLEPEICFFGFEIDRETAGYEEITTSSFENIRQIYHPQFCKHLFFHGDYPVHHCGGDRPEPETGADRRQRLNPHGRAYRVLSVLGDLAGEYLFAGCGFYFGHLLYIEADHADGTCGCAVRRDEFSPDYTALPGCSHGNRSGRAFCE